MRGLRKYLTPFAPDQSGAVSVLYEFGGIIVICDAGGCTGNICGFDEPRWFESKSALFSAGLRDMDAILGRDDRLVAKLADAVTKLDAKFAAIIGTPVPAVIGTDYHALKRMAEKKVDLPISSTFFSSIGKAYKGTFLSLTRQILFLLPLLLLFPRFWGIKGILYASPVADVLSFAVGLAMVIHEFQLIRKLEVSEQNTTTF